MSKIRDQRNLSLNKYFAIATLVSIAFGVFLQVGPFVYTSTVTIKLVGLVLPLSLATVLLWKNNSSVNFWMSRFQLMWLFVLSLSCLYSLLNSSNIGRTLFGSADRNIGIITIFTYLFYFLAGKVIANQNSEKILRWGLIAMASLQSLTVFYQKFIKPDTLNGMGGFDPPGVWGTFYNANPLSFFLGVISPALLTYLLFQSFQSIQRRLVLISVLIIIILGLFWSGSSQGLIGFVLVSFVYLVKRFIQRTNKHFNYFLKVLFVLAVSTFFLAIVFLKVPNSSEVRSNPYLERLEIYKSSFEIFLNKPFFGVGIDNFQSMYGQVTTTTDLKLVDNAHSLPLQALSTQGLLGFALFVSMILWVLSIRKNQDLTTESEWGFWQAMFFSYVVTGTIGIDHPVIGSIAFLSAGVLYGKSTSQRIGIDSRLVKEKKQNFHFFFPTSAVLLSILVLIFALPEIRSSIAVYELSKQRMTPQEFKGIVDTEYKKVQNARLLLVLGQAMIAINERDSANFIATRMLTSFADDQRTSALLFAIADKWGDKVALEAAERVKRQVFPNYTI